MCSMPRKIDEEVRVRAVRLVTDHLSEYPSLTAAAWAVARQVCEGASSPSSYQVRSVWPTNRTQDTVVTPWPESDRPVQRRGKSSQTLPQVVGSLGREFFWTTFQSRSWCS